LRPQRGPIRDQQTSVGRRQRRLRSHVGTNRRRRSHGLRLEPSLSPAGSPTKQQPAKQARESATEPFPCWVHLRAVTFCTTEAALHEGWRRPANRLRTIAARRARWFFPPQPGWSIWGNRAEVTVIGAFGRSGGGNGGGGNELKSRWFGYRQVLGRYRYEFKRDSYYVESGDYGWY
jgi:hypothetical protein